MRVALLLAVASAAFGQQDVTLTISVAGHSRTAYVHLPPNSDHDGKYPLVIGYHGGLGTARGYARQSRLFEKAEKVGFIAVCPEGTLMPANGLGMLGQGEHRIWNSGLKYARPSADADDVEFTRQLIGRLAAEYGADRKRVYATGFSNGAQMCYRLALELGEGIAAIAPMSGGRLADGLRPSRAVPILHFHGTADDYYPFAGGRGPRSIGPTSHADIARVIAEWVEFNGAAAAARVVEQHTGWFRQIHDGKAPIELVLVDGMGHQIAGGLDDRLPQQAMRAEPDAIQMALDFFAAHPIP